VVIKPSINPGYTRFLGMEMNSNSAAVRTTGEDVLEIKDLASGLVRLAPEGWEELPGNFCRRRPRFVALPRSPRLRAFPVSGTITACSPISIDSAVLPFS
jgi:hypothetical protein